MRPYSVLLFCSEIRCGDVARERQRQSSIGRTAAARERERVKQPEPRWSSSSAAAQWPPPPEKQQRHEQRAAPTTVMDLGWRYSTRIYRVGNTADQYQDRSVWHHRKPLAAAAGGGSASLAASRKSLKLAARKKALACPWGPNELFAKRDEPSEEALRDPSPAACATPAHSWGAEHSRVQVRVSRARISLAMISDRASGSKVSNNA